MSHTAGGRGSPFITVAIIFVEPTIVPAPYSHPLILLHALPLTSPLPAEETGSAPKTIVYQLDEGIYGIFNSVLFDNTCPTPVLQKVSHWGLFSVVWMCLNNIFV